MRCALVTGVQTCALPISRASPLAMAQAHQAAAALVAAHGLDPEALVIVPMTATGDRIQDRALAEVGGKALWTRELDAALDAGVIDIAVHSLKDVETLRDARFALAAMLPRADPRDRLVVRSEEHTSELQSLMRTSYSVFCSKKKNSSKTRALYH